MNTQKTSILNLINEYRDCSRSLWNRYFMDRFQNTQNWNFVDSFKIIKEELFQSIVLSTFIDKDSIHFSLGKVSELISVKLERATEVQINRYSNEYNNAHYETAGYWDNSVKELDEHVTLLFVDFFDWNAYGFLDMTLVMCEISSNPNDPSIEGHRVLVNVDFVDIFLAQAKAE